MAKRFEATRTNVIWSYAGTVFSMASNFLLLPLIFHFLSKDEIGYWYLILSINGLTALLDFGFDPAFARNIAYVWSGISNLKNHGIESQDMAKDEVDFHLLSVTIHTARFVYLLLSIIAILLIGTLGTWYMFKVVFSQLKGNIYLITWIVFCVSMFLNLYFGYFSALLRGSGKIDAVNKAQVYSRLLQILATFLGFLIFPSVLVPVVGLLFYGVLFRFFCGHSFWTDATVLVNISEIKAKSKFSEVNEVFASIWPNTWRDGLVSMSNYVTTQGMSLMAGAFLPLAITGEYSIGVQFASAIGTAASAINGAVHPILQSLFVKRDYVSLRKHTATALASYVWVYWLGALFTVTIIFPLLEIIKPHAVPEIGQFILMLLYFFLFQMHSVHASYIANSNIIPYTKAFLISAVASLVLLWTMLRISNGNIYVLLVVPILVQGAYNNWYWPHYYYKMIDSDFISLMRIGTQSLKKRIKNVFR